MTIVIIVYYAMRISRRGTDAVVTRLFFAARNRRLQALREIADIVDQISDPEAIAPLATEYLRTRAGIEARVLLQGPNDAFVRAEDGAWETPAIARDDDLGVAFPMLVRAHVRGILFCRPPDDGDFAPDEVFLLQQLANRMAIDRDDLLATAQRQELDALRSEMAELRANLGVSP